MRKFDPTVGHNQDAAEHGAITFTTKPAPVPDGRRLTSVTALKQWSRCRRQWMYDRFLGLRPKDRPIPLRFGSLLHECLELFYRDKVVLFSDFVHAKVDAEIAALRTDPASYNTTEDEVREIGELCLGVMHGYVVRYAASDHERFEVLGVELPFRFPVRVPCGRCEGAGCDKCGGSGLGRASPTWDVHGFIDLLVRDKHHGVTLVKESKSTVESDVDQFMRKLVIDPQPRVYVTAARLLVKEHGWPPVGGVFYDVVRRKIPAEPVRLKCACDRAGAKHPGFDKDGVSPCPKCSGTKSIGLSKSQGTDTTFDVYRNALAQLPHVDVSEYGDVLQKLMARGDRFFAREHHHVSARDESDWMIEAYQATRDIAEATRSGRFYRNTDACDLQGRSCPFKSLCLEDRPEARARFTSPEERAATEQREAERRRESDAVSEFGF